MYFNSLSLFQKDVTIHSWTNETNSDKWIVACRGEVKLEEYIYWHKKMGSASGHHWCMVFLGFLTLTHCFM